MVHHSPPTQRRSPAPTLLQLETELESSTASLREVLDSDHTSESPEYIATLISQCKTQWRSFHDHSAILTDRYIKEGSVQQAQEARRARAEMRTEVKQFIDLGNASLKLAHSDLLSNIDSASIVSEPPYETPTTTKETADLKPEMTLEAPSPIEAYTRTGPPFTKVHLSTTAQPTDVGSVSDTSKQPAVRPKVVKIPFTNSKTGQSPFEIPPVEICNATRYHNKPIPHSGPLEFTDRSTVTLPYPYSTYDEPKYRQGQSANLGSELPYSKQAYPPFEESNTPELSGTTLHLLKQDLFKQAANPFGGEYYRYRSWVMLFENKIKGLPLNSLDIISILEANTIGDPRSLIQNYLAAGAACPDETLKKIWNALHKQYGSAVKVSQSMQNKLHALHAIRSYNSRSKLQELLDLCRLIEVNIPSNPELQLFNLSSGQKQVWSKLPDWMQRKWRSRAHSLSVQNAGSLPPFSVLVDFIEDNLDELSNPNFEPLFEPKAVKSTSMTNAPSHTTSCDVKCLFHGTQGHQLINCRTFSKLPYQDKQKFAYEKKLCYKCLAEHMSKDCNNKQRCSICKRDHIYVMHSDRRPQNAIKFPKKKPVDYPPPEQDNNALCSVVCGGPNRALSCSKTILSEVHHVSHPEKRTRMYVILDDHSNSSYIHEKVVDLLNLTGRREKYLLNTLNSFRTEHEGLAIEGLRIKGISEDKYFTLPELLTSDFIPGSIYEVGTPAIVNSIPKIASYANKFLELDEHAEPLMLLGRDTGDLMKSICFGDHSPFVCQTPLGYALIGFPCINRDKKSPVQANTVLKSCHDHFIAKRLFPKNVNHCKGIFDEFQDDDCIGISRDDMKFQTIVEQSIHVNSSGHITISLPFKSNDPMMPDNKAAVYCRTMNTLNKLKSQPDKLKQCTDAISKNISAGHIEIVPEDELNTDIGKCWFIPIFPVSHPKKNKTRLVFDSSASYKGTSLNSALLQGPDLNNRLRGILMRFRTAEVALCADVEAMFYNFYLPKSDRNFLRFFWFHDNNPNKSIVQYRGRVHLFGNSCSPALAHAGLQYTTLHPEAAIHPEAVCCITRNIYVDDLLASCRSTDEAITNLETIREIFQRYNIRLCKIVSNRSEVINHFPESERATDSQSVHLGSATIHRALGLAWHTSDDHFFIEFRPPDRPFTRRGLLAVTGSLYDPLGIVGPVSLKGKIIQRQVLQANDNTSIDWDEPLSPSYADEWENWLNCLSAVDSVTLQRSYIPPEFGSVVAYELHAFSDASDLAVGSVVYLRIIDNKHKIHVSYVISMSNLIPKSCNSMPRRELCAALMGARLYYEVKRELDFEITDYYMYCDSKVVLGYLNNSEKRFSKYVSNRVFSILKVTDKDKWFYINSDLNPADIASRPQSVESLKRSVWLRGPDFLWTIGSSSPLSPHLDAPDELPELVDVKAVMRIDRNVSGDDPFEKLLCRTSKLLKAVNVTRRVIAYCSQVCKMANIPLKLEKTNASATRVLVIASQRPQYRDIFSCLRKGEPIKDHRLASLHPFVDKNDILRVGGRLNDSLLSYGVKHPILLPSDTPLSHLIVRHYHESSMHPGRHITLGAVRAAGYFIEKCSRLIRSLIGNCLTCRKLRAKPQEQMMAPLPRSRVEETTPFHNTGLDVFGPFLISESRSTRQTKGTKKMWGLLLTCMASRAIHIEPLCGLDTSSLVNALRRFLAIRGPCRNLYSDQGTNFIGLKNQEELSIGSIKHELETRDCTWHFNPPHASHFGGPWERKIGALRRILEGSLAQFRGRTLSRDELSTLLQEAAAIVNSTPLWEISADPQDPFPVSPTMLLTLKDSDSPPPAGDWSPEDVSSYGAKRWRRVQYLAECFWQRWRTYYLANMQERSKWTHKRRNLREGDLVLIRNKSEKRNSWPIGLVKEVKTSKDGLVRSVKIQSSDKETPRGLLERPISELILLVAND